MLRTIRNAFLLVATLVVCTVLPFKTPTSSSASEGTRLSRTSWDTRELERQRQELAALLTLRERKLNAEGARDLAGPLVTTANKYGWDPLMILAIMEIESNLTPDAKSYAGAIGLMQLIPYVAKDQAQQAGIRYEGPASLHDAVTNLEIGVSYMTELRDRYNGRPELYLTAYNLGPSKLDARLRSTGQHWFTYSTKILRRYETLRRQMNDIRARRAALVGEIAG